MILHNAHKLCEIFKDESMHIFIYELQTQAIVKTERERERLELFESHKNFLMKNELHWLCTLNRDIKGTHTN